MTQVFSAGRVVTIQVTGVEDYNEAYAILDMVNAERAKENLPALKMDKELLESAMQRAAECSIYYSHTRPDGTDCFTAFPSKYEYQACGENIAIGYSSAADVMNGWMTSLGHKENILDSDFTNIGIGCFYQDGAFSWVQLFASGSGTALSPKPTTKIDSSKINVNTDNLDIYYNFVQSEDPIGTKCTLHNLNTKFTSKTGFIQLDPYNVTYSSKDKEILNIQSNGFVNSANIGETTLYGYIEGVLVLETPVEFVYSEYIIGDANSDGEISNSDLIVIARYIVGLEGEINLIAADVDGNGEVTNSDIITIARYIVGLD